MIWLLLTLALLATMALVIRIPRLDRHGVTPSAARRKRPPSVVPLDETVAEHAEHLRRSRPAR
jgi:hypothetical protein